jgi:hypothetical protein
MQIESERKGWKRISPIYNLREFSIYSKHACKTKEFQEHLMANIKKGAKIGIYLNVSYAAILTEGDISKMALGAWGGGCFGGTAGIALTVFQLYRDFRKAKGLLKEDIASQEGKVFKIGV